MRKLDLPLNAYFGFDIRYDPFVVGLEIETEGQNLPNFGGKLTSKYWRTVAEGSLRNGGCEHVFRQPIGLKGVDNALKEWDNATVLSTFIDSIRTSVHIHYNVASLKLSQIYSIVAAYWFFENVLVHLNGDSRVGNLFCLRVKDAEYTCQSVLKDLKTDQHFHEMSGDGFRYSALNLAALRKFGSLEFRFLRGYHESSVIRKWTYELHKMISTASEFDTPKTLLDFYRRSGPKVFLSHFFTDDFTKEIIRTLGEDKAFGMIVENKVYVERLARYFDYPRVSSKKIEYVDEDLVNPLVDKSELKVKKKSPQDIYNLLNGG